MGFFPTKTTGNDLIISQTLYHAFSKLYLQLDTTFEASVRAKVCTIMNPRANSSVKQATQRWKS